MNDPTQAGLRTSDSNPSLKPISNRTGSARPIISSFGNYHHALLKSNAQRQQLAKKDPPMPPVITYSRPNSTDGDITQHSRPQKPASQIPTPTEVSIHSTDTTGPCPADTNLEGPIGNGTHSPPEYESHFRTRRLPISKVRPATGEAEESEILEAQREHHSTSPVLSEETYSVDDHFQHHHADTPKVRPFSDSSSIETSHLHGEGRKTGEPLSPDPTNRFHEQEDTESRNAAVREGFLPGLGEIGSKDASEIDQPDDAHTTGSRAGSPYLSGADSHMLLNNVEVATPISEHQRERLYRQGLEAINDHIWGKDIPSNSIGRMGGSIASLSVSISANDNERHEPSRPQKLGAHRNGRWLQGLLGFSKPNSQPSLIKLAGISSPGPQSYDDSRSVASETTTYSCENTADKKVMNYTTHSLQNFLRETLCLDNEAGDRHGHVDDGGLPLRHESEDSIHTPSFDESIRYGSSEHGDPMFGSPLRGVSRFTENLDDKHEASASGPYSDIPRPTFFDRKGGTADSAGHHYHSADDNCILPVPLFDRLVKQENVCDEDDPTDGTKSGSGELPNCMEIREYIKLFHQPPICTRSSSKIASEAKGATRDGTHLGLENGLFGIRCRNVSVHRLDDGMTDEAVDFSTQHGTNEKQHPGFAGVQGSLWRVGDEKSVKDPKNQPKKRATLPNYGHELRNLNLRNKSHISIGEKQLFSLTKSARRQPTIARDWSPARKRFVATVACVSTALVGVLIGIYAGLVPSIQYYIADFHHYTILGNVGLYLGMALPSLFCWPLPLLHGRKPYVVGALCIAMPLLFPQALAIGARRSPYTRVWRVALLLPRALMGFVLGFANMNFHSMLTDLFGASLMSRNPHQEVVDEYDVRRHGGGLGVWLGIWTWCFIGSLSVGFLVGAVVIEYLQPSWGLYISIIVLAVVLLLNVLCPEVRRAAWRRSVAEVRIGETISRRVARGEIMMHRVQTGPRWWGQEMYHGVALSLEMLRQPGFGIMAVYSAWIYAQVVLIIVLLGSLTSRSYRFRSPYVSAVVSSVAIGAFAAIPFQKANILSRARKTSPPSNTMTFDKKLTWSSHLVRRSIFVLVLPIAGIVYTVVSTGPSIHVFVPSLFAALIGFLSCLAISECNGLLMETWDCSDLQPGMTGRSKSSKDSHKRTNYSSFPRVTAGWNFIQSLGFIFAAGATALGGTVTRRLGQRTATGVVAGILLILTLLLLSILIRFKRVQIIPDCTCSEMDRWTKERRVSLHNWAAAMAEAKEKGMKALNEIPEDDVG